MPVDANHRRQPSSHPSANKNELRDPLHVGRWLLRLLVRPQGPLISGWRSGLFRPYQLVSHEYHKVHLTHNYRIYETGVDFPGNVVAQE